MNDGKMMVDQRTLEYQLSIPEKVIEHYTSDAYHRLWRQKKVKVPPLPMVEFGEKTKRFMLDLVREWALKFFDKERAFEAGGGAL